MKKILIPILSGLLLFGIAYGATPILNVFQGGTGVSSFPAKSIITTGSIATSSLTASSSITVDSVIATSTSNSASSTFLFLYGSNLISSNSTGTQATTSSLYIYGTITGAGLTNCTGATNKITWKSSINQFACETDQNSGGGGGGADTLRYQAIDGPGADYLYASSTAVGLLFPDTASTTLMRLTFNLATGTQATSTYFNISTLASTSQLTVSASSTFLGSYIDGFLFRNATGTNATTTGQAYFSGNFFVDSPSSTIRNLSFNAATGSAATTTSLRVVGATNLGGTFTCSNCVTNADLANSTISGVALGNNLNSHTHDSTLSGTSYNGSAAVSDWGLNLGNANTWTAQQTFSVLSGTGISSGSKNDSITNLTVTNGTTTNATTTGLAYFSGFLYANTSSSTIYNLSVSSATTSFATTTTLSITNASTTNLNITGLGNTGTRCLQVTNQGVVQANGSGCGGAGATPAGSSGDIQINNAGSFGTANPFIWDITNSRLGLGTSTPWGAFSIATTTNPSFIIATTSGVAITKIFSTEATTTGLRDYARVSVGASSTMATSTQQPTSGLRDQLTVGGRIYSTSLYQACDFPGSVAHIGVGSNITAADASNFCGGFSFNSDSNGNVQAVSETMSAVRLASGTGAGNGSGLQSGTPSFAATSSPVFETWVKQPNSQSHKIVMVGFSDIDVATGDLAAEPSNGVYFVASSSVSNNLTGPGGTWWAVTMNGGTGTYVDTKVSSTTTSFVNFQKLRIELNENLATFLIDGGVVASINTNIPTVGLASVVSAGVQGPPTVARTLDVGAMRLWVNNPY